MTYYYLVLSMTLYSLVDTENSTYTIKTCFVVYNWEAIGTAVLIFLHACINIRYIPRELKPIRGCQHLPLVFKSCTAAIIL